MANKKRLIDANTFTWSMALNDNDEPFLYVTADYIDKCPTVDAVEVVHGRWIHKNTCGPNTEKFHCSVCDKTPRSLYPEKFCPNCGAKMDGDKNG